MDTFCTDESGMFKQSFGPARTTFVRYFDFSNSKRISIYKISMRNIIVYGKDVDRSGLSEPYFARKRPMRPL